MAKKEIKYKDAVAEIEAIVKKIESSDLDVDEITKDIQRASELINICKSKLYATEEQIDKILESIDNN